jgi:tRNA nucleotidyltransferase/poly(A) polymerase
VRFGVDLQTDAARRDFSCNAVYLKPNGTLIDPYGGVEHLKAGRVVWVEEPIRKLTEDPIRWWRWVRFCGLYGVTSVVAPTWVGADGREQVCTLEPLAQAVMAAKRAVSASRWAAERKHADTVRGAQAVRTALQQGLAAHPAWQEELTP